MTTSTTKQGCWIRRRLILIPPPLLTTEERELWFGVWDAWFWLVAELTTYVYRSRDVQHNLGGGQRSQENRTGKLEHHLERHLHALFLCCSKFSPGRMRTMLLIPTAIRLCAILTFPIYVGAELHRFTSWFPRYDHPLNNLTVGGCSAEYLIYATDALQNASTFAKLEDWNVDSAASPLIDCLLENTPEMYKSAMASAQVMLGLMPTILVSVGPSIYETSILFSYGQRHILGLLILLGSPSVLFDNTVGFRQQVTDILSPQDNISMSLLLGPNWFTVLTEYTLALAAIANVGEVCYEIGTRSVTSVAQDAPFLPAIWIFVGVVTHLLGASIFAMLKKRSNTPSVGHFLPAFNLWEWTGRQFWPAKQAERIRLEFLPCSLLEMMLSWVTSMIGTVNLIFGTLVFSSLLFISIRDSLFIILRFMASAIVCRAIARYEICTIRDAIGNEEESTSLHGLRSPHDSS